MKYRDMEHRLISNSAVCEETGCWNWLGSLNAKGYGKICIRVRVIKKRHRRKSTAVGHPTAPRGFLAHRVAYETFNAVKLKEWETVDHKCVNPRCINPNHLQAMSNGANLRLQWARRRKAESGQVAAF